MMGRPSAARLRFCRSATVAVEAALVAPIFLATLFFVFECSLNFFYQQILDSAAQTASRSIQVGAAQTTATSLDVFRSAIFCPALMNVLNCNDVVLEVKPSADFYADAQITTPPVTSSYCNGAPNQTMLLRAEYPSPSVFASFYPLNLTTKQRTAISIQSSIAFMDEAFSTYASPSC
jgi:Flp pilus assembly protein TadG